MSSKASGTSYTSCPLGLLFLAATANITALHETEVRLTLQCKQFLLAGLVGVTPVTPTWLADGEVDILWGNHVKVYDYV